MIPKTIHYCWFGRGDKPDLAKKCIESWKKYCPDYKIIEWNEDNFDIDINSYVREAYDAKKYAFVTDYVRLYVLEKYGGIYMDSDVEVIKPLDHFLNEKAFSSFENNDYIPTGIMASEKNNLWIKSLLHDYDNLHFINNGNMDLTPNTIRITKTTIDKFKLIPHSSYQKLGNGVVTIYPHDFFCPKSHITNEIEITENTHTIHHFAGSWMRPEEIERKKIKDHYIKKFGSKKGIIIGNAIYSIKHPITMMKKILFRHHF